MKELPEWAVYLLRKKAQLIGFVRAKDEAEALKRAFEEIRISTAEEISVQRV